MRKSLILLVLPLIVAASRHPAPDLSSRAKGNLAALISDGDYPESAIAAEEQGIVSFALDVARDGHVTGCAIEASSGSAALDAATCRIMTTRGRFIPAHDRKGRPTTDRLHARIKWILPRSDEEEGGNGMVPAPQPSQR